LPRGKPRAHSAVFAIRQGLPACFRPAHLYFYIGRRQQRPITRLSAQNARCSDCRSGDVRVISSISMVLTRADRRTGPQSRKSRSLSLPTRTVPPGKAQAWGVFRCTLGRYVVHRGPRRIRAVQMVIRIAYSWGPWRPSLLITIGVASRVGGDAMNVFPSKRTAPMASPCGGVSGLGAFDSFNVAQAVLRLTTKRFMKRQN